MDRRPGILAASLLCVLLCRALVAAPASAQSGIQTTPDGKRTLVSKDVGAQRWALTRNTRDGSVTGNVFTTDGSDPQFVACSETSRNEDGVSLRCEGADRCRLTPCTNDEWVFIADVTLPLSFFEPETAGINGFASASLAQPVGRVAQTTQQAGVQTTPTQSAVLVNKDVGGGQRWAITLNADDNTVTGNVFFPGGEDPAFVWCEKQGFDGDELFLDCFGADRCSAQGCRPEDWEPIFSVPIAENFFLAPEQIRLETLDSAITGALGSAVAFDALVLAFGKGYSFRQIAAAGLAGRIRPPGDLVDRLGRIIPPAGVEFGTSLGLAQPNGAERAKGTDPIRLDPGVARRRLLEKGANPEAIGTALLFMVNRGYTTRQILEAIEQDRIAFTQESLRGDILDAFIIVDEDGKAITPLPVGELDVLFPRDSGGFTCGNGRVDPGESCESGSEITQACTDFGFDAGALSCVTSICRYSTRGCRRCGDGIRSSGEECDGRDVRRETCSDRGFSSPTVPSCTADCKIDDAPCRQTVEDGCPDGNLDPGEECDGTKFRGGTQCSAADAGETGILTCDALTCRYDTSRCAGQVPAGCGNGILEPEEACEGTQLRETQCASFDSRYESGELSCNRASCTYDTSACTENSAAEGECGDGELDPGEECDGSALRESACRDIDTRFDDGTLRCRPDCTYDRDACRGCGDGLLDDDENCEPGLLGNFTCEILGFGPGPLRCDDRCDFDTSSCGDPADLCGNGIVNSGEECDGPIPGGLECFVLDGAFADGSVTCTSDCRFDTSDCTAANVCEEMTCPDGTCAPFGGDCCGGGFFCAAGSVCVDGGCCPSGLTQVCGTRCIAPGDLCCGGVNACIPGSKCCNGGCIPQDLTCCALGGACEPGSVCTDIPLVCCPVDAPKPCVSDMTCRPNNVPCP